LWPFLHLLTAPRMVALRRLLLEFYLLLPLLRTLPGSGSRSCSPGMRREIRGGA
jgi:hypothetical protein